MRVFDLIVVGSGPGGYPAAIAAAKAGLRVALVEDRGVGGECVLYGCVPSKALVAAYKGLRQVRLAGGEASLPIEASLSYSRSVALSSSSGLRELMERLGIEIYDGRGRLTPGGTVEVGGQRLEARLGVIYAPGSVPLIPEPLRINDNTRVLDNRGLFEKGLPERAESVAIVGGGYIGVELAQVLALAGLKVHLFEAMDRLLPALERDLALIVRRILTRLGAKIYTKTPVTGLERSGRRLRVLAKNRSVEVDSVIVAVGRRPVVSEALRAGATLTEGGFIAVNSCNRTTVPWLYSTGDAAGPPLLAHKAIHESLSALHCMLGGEPRGLGPVPQVVFGIVDLVSVGETLEEARTRDPEAYEVRIPTGGFSSQRIQGIAEGFAKIVVSKERIVGFHAAFPGASEAAGEASLLVSRMLSVEDVAEAIHPHPTMSEALWETAMEALEGAIHVLRGRKR